MTLVRAAVLDERALAFMSVSASRLVTMSLVDCGLRLGLPSTGVRRAVPEPQRWRSSLRELWFSRRSMGHLSSASSAG